MSAPLPREERQFAERAAKTGDKVCGRLVAPIPLRTIQLRKDESFHVDAQVVIIRTVRWVEVLQRYVIEYEVGR